MRSRRPACKAACLSEVTGQVGRDPDVLLGRLGEQLVQSDVPKESGSLARDTHPAEEADDGDSHPEGIAGGGHSVVRERIQHDVHGVVGRGTRIGSPSIRRTRASRGRRRGGRGFRGRVPARHVRPRPGAGAWSPAQPPAPATRRPGPRRRPWPDCSSNQRSSGRTAGPAARAPTSGEGPARNRTRNPASG